MYYVYIIHVHSCNTGIQNSEYTCTNEVPVQHASVKKRGNAESLKANSDDTFFDARRGCVKMPPVFCEIGIDLNSMHEIVDNRTAFVCEWLKSHFPSCDIAHASIMRLGHATEQRS